MTRTRELDWKRTRNGSAVWTWARLGWQGLRAVVKLVLLAGGTGMWMVTAGPWHRWRARRACYKAMVEKGMPTDLARQLSREFPTAKEILRPLWGRLKH